MFPPVIFAFQIILGFIAFQKRKIKKKKGLISIFHSRCIHDFCLRPFFFFPPLKKIKKNYSERLLPFHFPPRLLRLGQATFRSLDAGGGENRLWGKDRAGST